MAAQWLTAFVDRPSASISETAQFWCDISDSRLSPWRGDNAEFATFLPNDGSEPYFRVQRTASGGSDSHIDLHVKDVPTSVRNSLQHGAHITADHGDYVIMESPAGMPFCFVPDNRNGDAPEPNSGDHSPVQTHLAAVVIEVAPTDFGSEEAFWSTVTGWPSTQSKTSPAITLQASSQIPISLVVAPRVVPESRPTSTLSLRCTDLRGTVAQHQQLGATLIDHLADRAQLLDPSGTSYLVTATE